ncbi:MAG: hypothetical protein ACFWTZ_10105 [Burkholderia sp.]|jgi:hypothetical protein
MADNEDWIPMEMQRAAHLLSRSPASIDALASYMDEKTFGRMLESYLTLHGLYRPDIARVAAGPYVFKYSSSRLSVSHTRSKRGELAKPKSGDAMCIADCLARAHRPEFSGVRHVSGIMGTGRRR